MKPRRLADQLLGVVLILSLLTGCGLGTTLTATPGPLQAAINSATLDPQPASEQALNRAEQDTIELLREQSGARAALGDQADAIFLQIDQAKDAMAQELVKQAEAGSSYTPIPPQLNLLAGVVKTMGGVVVSSMDYQEETLGAAMFVLAITPFMFSKVGRDADGNAKFPPQEMTQTVGGTTMSATYEVNMTGSMMEVKVVMTASMTEPIVFKETTTGTISVNVCPDAQGNVPLQFSFRSVAALYGGGQQLELKTQATGHVDDKGELAYVDSQITGSGARQPVQGAGENWGTTNQYLEFTININNKPGAKTVSGEINRKSSDTDQHTIDEIGILLTRMSIFMTSVALGLAESQWKGGYCLELTVPGMGKSVRPNSDTPFTATVRHKFEGVDLQVPVIATLSAGEVSASPSGSEVQSPASFTYKAPGELEKTATVNLVTRSKRGVATLDIKFKTGSQGWKIGALEEPTGHSTGFLSCDSPYGPWDFKQDNSSPDSDVGPGSTSWTTFKIPYSADGNSIGTWEHYTLYMKDTYDNTMSGPVTITLRPYSNGYEINYGVFTGIDTVCYDGKCFTTTGQMEPRLGAWNIDPAGPGECGNP